MVGLGIKIHCVGEDQQQFSSQSVSHFLKGLKVSDDGKKLNKAIIFDTVQSLTVS
jgi:hypothetical protein